VYTPTIEDLHKIEDPKKRLTNTFEMKDLGDLKLHIQKDGSTCLNTSMQLNLLQKQLIDDSKRVEFGT
jgi:hypothetical protein